MNAGSLVRLLVLLTLISLTACATVQGQDESAAAPENIILFVGDGMGLAQIELTAYQRTGSGDRATPGLLFEDLPVVGVVTTHSADSFVTDSAAAATAFACGVKTNNGMLGQEPDGTSAESILKIAARQGMATGVVSSVPVNHATPAGFIANVDSRHDADGILTQYFEYNVADVILGGGMSLESLTQEQVHEMATAAGYDCIIDPSALGEIGGGDRVFGHFDVEDNGHLAYLADRTGDAAGEPRLVDLAMAAVEALSADEDGFFLMVEGGAIDWAGHANDAENVINETLEFEAAIDAVCYLLEDLGRLDDTLIIVTADHETGGLTLPGPYRSSLASGSTAEVAWGSTGHTGTPVPLWAAGPGSAAFAGRYDNTDIFLKMRDALGE